MHAEPHPGLHTGVRYIFVQLKTKFESVCKFTTLIFMKIRPGVLELLYAERRTDGRAER
jgi:hypothetical protein